VANAPDVRFRELLYAAPDATIVFESDGSIVFLNGEAAELFGRRPEETPRGSIEQLIPDLGADTLSRPNRRTARLRPVSRGSNGGRPLRGRREDGSEFPIEIRMSALDSGKALLFTLVARPLARDGGAPRVDPSTPDSRPAASEIERGLAVVAHDLQAPLRTVRSFAELLARRYRGRIDAEADELTGFVVDGVTRMQRMIDDLLDYARFSNDQRSVAVVDCEEVFEQAMWRLAGALQESNGIVTHDPLPPVPGDHSQLVRLFQNLIGNAIMFHDDVPPLVHVSAIEHASGWLFSCRDNGIGVLPGDGQRIFGLFQRAHDPTRFLGTGMGLSICKRIVGNHGGQIWVESQPGEGATFYFTISAKT
jgi:PAS domain S-box-containing protein